MLTGEVVYIKVEIRNCTGKLLEVVPVKTLQDGQVIAKRCLTTRRGQGDSIVWFNATDAELIHNGRRSDTVAQIKGAGTMSDKKKVLKKKSTTTDAIDTKVTDTKTVKTAGKAAAKLSPRQQRLATRAARREARENGETNGTPKRSKKVIGDKVRGRGRVDSKIELAKIFATIPSSGLTVAELAARWAAKCPGKKVDRPTTVFAKFLVGVGFLKVDTKGKYRKA